MGKEPTNPSWAHVLSVYDSFVGLAWQHIPEFRKVVARLSTCEEASGLTAITSHEVLIISPYTRYPDWLEGRHVQAHPLHDGTVRIYKAPEPFDRRPPETWIVPVKEAEEKIRGLLAEL